MLKNEGSASSAPVDGVPGANPWGQDPSGPFAGRQTKLG